MKINLKLIYIVIIATVMIIATIFGASALGVSRPYEKDNTYEVDENETLAIVFQLQNMESTSKKMVFGIESQHVMEIEGGDFYEKQFTLDSKERKDVEIEFLAEEEGLYRVDYYYAESCDSGDICFDVTVRDTFFIQVGDDHTYWGFDIPLIYDGFRLYTEAMSASNVNDLEIISEDGLIEVDFSGSAIDLTDFDESYVSFGTRKVTLNSNEFPDFDNEAVITMYQVNDNYIIYKDGSKCSSSICNVLSYSSKRLRFEVDSFSTYEVKYETIEDDIPVESGSSGGSITPRGEVVVEEELIEDIPEEVKVQLEETKEPVNIDDILGAPSPFGTGANKVETPEKTEKTNMLSGEGKTLLTQVLILGVLCLLIGGGLVFYVKKDKKTGEAR